MTICTEGVELVSIIDKNLAEFELLGIIKWHEAGYTGKGIKIAELETVKDSWIFDGMLRDPFGIATDNHLNKHGQKELDIVHQVAPDAELFTLPGGLITKGDYAEGSFLEKTMPYVIEHGIDIVGASTGGNKHPMVIASVQKAKETGTVFTTSAGNAGKKGLSGYAETNEWIAIGALGLREDSEIYLKNYSAQGPELDIMGFSGLYVHNANDPKDIIGPIEGTSFSHPVSGQGMLALVQQFFLEKAGRKLYQKEIELFICDNVVDLGADGFDEEYGLGMFVLPDPKEIDVKKYLIYGEPIIETVKETDKDDDKGAKEMNGKTLYIDDGHGMETAGKRTPVFPEEQDVAGLQIHENQFNAAVAEKLKNMAELEGYRVVMTAPEETDTPLGTRTARANADMTSNGLGVYNTAFISIHYNALNGKWDGESGGIEVYHYPGSAGGTALAVAIHQELKKGIVQVDRGIKEANFYVLRETSMPAVLIEAGFMDCLKEAERMLDPVFQNEVARETLDGINNYFGVAPCTQCQGLRNQVEKLELECSTLKSRLKEIATIAKGE